MGSVLVASLGKSPGVITAMVDALVKKGEDIERVVIVYVKDIKRSSGEPIEVDELNKEFSDTGPYKGKITLDYKCNWVAGKDIGEAKDHASLDDFYKKTLSIVRDLVEAKQDVIVGIGGGRKAMSSIMTYTALTLKVEKIYQVIVSEQVERIGSYKEYTNRGCRDQALHPQSDQRWLVRLPNERDIEKVRAKLRDGGNGSAKNTERILEHETFFRRQ